MYKQKQEKINRRVFKEFTPICKGISILRGSYSLSNYKFSKTSRNNQSLPIAIAAVVMSKIEFPENWSFRDINAILDAGDNLYKNSWFYYKPYYNKNLGLENILRTIRIGKYKITTKIYQSNVMGDLVLSSFFVGLINFFLHNVSGIISTNRYNIGIFQRHGYYYYVDPYNRDENGNCVRYGLACALRFSDVKEMAEKIYNTAVTQGRVLSKDSEEAKMRYYIYGLAIQYAEEIDI